MHRRPPLRLGRSRLRRHHQSRRRPWRRRSQPRPDAPRRQCGGSRPRTAGDRLPGRTGPVIKLDATLNRLVEEARKAPATAETAARALPLLDLTSLNDDDTDERIAALCDRAVTPAGRVAAVCIHPRFIPLAKRRLADKAVAIATVINFPAGGPDAAAVSADTRAAVKTGADEIDVVLPWRTFQAGERTIPHDVLSACRDACGNGVLMKVIL